MLKKFFSFQIFTCHLFFFRFLIKNIYLFFHLLCFRGVIIKSLRSALSMRNVFLRLCRLHNVYLMKRCGFTSRLSPLVVTFNFIRMMRGTTTPPPRPYLYVRHNYMKTAMGSCWRHVQPRHPSSRRYFQRQCLTFLAHRPTTDYCRCRNFE